MNLTTEQRITPESIAMDAERCARMYVSAQRYSVTRDSILTLGVRYDDYFMRDQRTDSYHYLSRAHTSEERLAAHWAGFLQTHKANL
jgi:hypothetical protein